MNLIGSFQQHPLVRDSFPFAPRRHQETPYFQSWLLNPSEVPTDFHLQSPPYPYPSYSTGPPAGPGPLEPRGGKRKAAAPKKERRRTESINTAFAELRECIPNVPADTKLSKIKTLRLATSYIAYLMDVLARDAGDSGDTAGFKADIQKCDNREHKRKREPEEAQRDALGHEKKLKGRTGWPQQVWALELNH